jgi:hypothetical protein
MKILSRQFSIYANAMIRASEHVLFLGLRSESGPTTINMFPSILSPSLHSDITPIDGNLHSLHLLHRVPRPTPLGAPSLSTPHLPPRHVHSFSRTCRRRRGRQVGRLRRHGGRQRRPPPGAHHSNLPGGDLGLGVWKLLAIMALSFAGVPTMLGYLVQAAR